MFIFSCFLWTFFYLSCFSSNLVSFLFLFKVILRFYHLLESWIPAHWCIAYINSVKNVPNIFRIFWGKILILVSSEPNDPERSFPQIIICAVLLFCKGCNIYFPCVVDWSERSWSFVFYLVFTCKRVSSWIILKQLKLTDLEKSNES